MVKSRLFHNAGVAYMNDRSKNELAQTLLTGATHNTQGSMDARIRIVLLLSITLIKSLKYSGAVLLIVLCVKIQLPHTFCRFHYQILDLEL